MLVGDEVDLGNVISGLVVLGFEHCSPLGKVENSDQTVTEENDGMLVIRHHSEVDNLAIFELARNLQFSLHWRIHHVHVR